MVRTIHPIQLIFLMFHLSVCFNHQPGYHTLAGITETPILVELNGSAQLGLLIRQQTGLSFDGSVFKYDGRPFLPSEIVEETLALIG